MPQFIKSHATKVVRELVRREVAQTVFVPAWVASGQLCDACGREIEEHDGAVMVVQVQHANRLYLHAPCAQRVIVEEPQ